MRAAARELLGSQGLFSLREGRALLAKLDGLNEELRCFQRTLRYVPLARRSERRIKDILEELDAIQDMVSTAQSRLLELFTEELQRA